MNKIAISLKIISKDPRLKRTMKNKVILDITEIRKGLKFIKRNTPNRISKTDKSIKAVSFDKNISIKSGRNPIQFKGFINEARAA